MTDGVVAGLEQAGIIYRSTNLAARGSVFAFNLHPWAWEYLATNESILANAAPEKTERPGYPYDDRDPP